MPPLCDRGPRHAHLSSHVSLRTRSARRRPPLDQIANSGRPRSTPPASHLESWTNAFINSCFEKAMLNPVGKIIVITTISLEEGGAATTDC